MIVVVAIVVDVLLTISIAVNVVVPPIVATRDLALGAIGAAIVGGVTYLATEVLRRFAKEAFFQPLNLLTVEQTLKFFLLVESLKKGCDRFNGRVLQRLSAENELLAVAFMVRHIIPLERERVQWFWDVASRQKLGNTKHLFKPLRVQTGGGVTRSFMR